MKQIKESKCKVQVTRDGQQHQSRLSMTGSSMRSLKEKDKYSQEKLFLPDGTHIVFDEEWNKCFDIYFSTLYTKQMSVQDMICYTLQAVDLPVRRSLGGIVILTGGATAAPMFAKRLAEEYESMMLPVPSNLSRPANAEKACLRNNVTEGRPR